MGIETEMNETEQKYFEAGGNTEAEPKESVEQTSDTGGHEATTEVAASDEAAKPKERFVPHGAFHEERQKRKEVEQRLEQERVNRAKLEERLNILAESVRQRQEREKPQIPAFEEDPANHLRMQTQMEAERITRLEKALAQREQQSRADAEDKNFVTSYQAKAIEFSAKTPDFKEAYNHILRSRIEDYKVMGHTEEEALRFTLNDERAIASNAMKRGLNPAEVIYNLAKRGGYAPRQASTDLAAVNKGVQAAKSIGQISGRTGASKLSLEAIANMSDAEFSEATKGANWEKLWA